MVKINRVYTGGGDDGESSLVDGSRRRKSDPRFSVVGTCDEANSWLGMVLAEINRVPDHEDGGARTSVQRVQTVLNEALARVQNELFDLGAELACPPERLPEYMVLLSQGQTDVLMAEMDAWLTTLPELTSFILPAGSPPVACLQVARTVVRRLERDIVQLQEHEGEAAVRPLVKVYVNRLSDWLFVMGRWVSTMLNEEEALWVPLGKRPAEKGVAHRVEQMKASDDDFSSL
ncbi:MAG: ATP:cob(I)alamin adenosyltransferase [Euryarchaeota archaeon]|nr:ATP:cob(I)alamin adenosyltransferase [Euryarchaeota archaeon]|tara:strand:- start:5945 stop:6640 length:696 start_codon:yes stop_codon:yes gene_type:complete